jgi:hypothetical protein
MRFSRPEHPNDGNLSASLRGCNRTKQRTKKENETMSNPALPSYLGTWDRLAAMLISEAYLGGLTPRSTDAKPDPWPVVHRPDSLWPPGWTHGSPLPLIRLVALKQTASDIKNQAVRDALLQSINSSIASEVDDICPPYRHWPWPGPPPWVLEIIATLTLAARTLPEGNLQNDLNGVAAEVMVRAMAVKNDQA